MRTIGLQSITIAVTLSVHANVIDNRTFHCIPTVFTLNSVFRIAFVPRSSYLIARRGLISVKKIRIYELGFFLPTRPSYLIA